MANKATSDEKRRNGMTLVEITVSSVFEFCVRGCYACTIGSTFENRRGTFYRAAAVDAIGFVLKRARTVLSIWYE